MPVLLLARGSEDARTLLRKAIEARYGRRPAAFDSLKIDFAGRVQTRLGPLKTWVPLDVSAQFIMPTSMRWDFTAKPAGVPIRRGMESFDGKDRWILSNGRPMIEDDAERVSSLQKRLWAIAALLLTPLGDHFVQLSLESDYLLAATNTNLDTTVYVQLSPQTNQIEEVFVDCLNPDTNKNERFRLRPSAELVMHDGLLLPARIMALWGDEPWFEVEPVAAENDPEISKSVFMLDAQSV